MRLWRIASRAYPALDGEGARLWGGRWNSPGRPLVYTSSTASLAVLEKLVWVDPEDVPANLALFEIDWPDARNTDVLRAASLTRHWTEPGSSECIEAGDRWLASGASATLIVPSAVLPEETNVLINPRHADARRARIKSTRPFEFDLRLLG